MTKHVVTTHARARRLGARPRAALDPSRPELRASPSGCSPARRRSSTLVTAAAIVWMLVFFARSGARHPVLPAALGLADRRQPLEPLRPRPARARDRLHRLQLVAGVQPRRQLHRDRRRDPARRARRRRPRAAAAAAHARRRRAVNGPARRRPGERLDQFLADALGSRAAAERAVDGGRARRRRRAAEEPPARGRRGARRSPAEPSVVPRRTTLPELPDRLRGRAPARRRQAGRARRAPGRRATRAARSSTHSRASSRAATRSGRGSCTGSTATRPGCSSSRGPRRRTSGCRQLVRERALERTYLALVEGRPRSRTRADRGADRPRPPRADADLARQRLAARRRHALRGRAAVRPTTRCCA